MISNYLTFPKHNKNVWHDLSERLPQMGWTVITTSTKEDQRARLLDMIWTIISKCRRYRLAQIDVFSGLAFVFAEVCSTLLRILRKPIVLTLHGGRLPEFAVQNEKRVTRLFKKAKVIVTPSPFLQQALQKYRSDIQLIENPVDLPLAIFRLRSEPKPNLVWVRSFHDTYNPVLVARFLYLLIDYIEDIAITMIGPDEGDGSKQRLLELARNLGIENRIKVIGAVTHAEIPTYLNDGDIFVNTSNYDTAPRSLIEALANGMCIVTTNVGGIPWIVQDEKEALLVPPNSPNKMAEAVRRILVEPGLAEKLSRNARTRALHYDWSDILPRWVELFEQVIREKDG